MFVLGSALILTFDPKTSYPTRIQVREFWVFFLVVFVGALKTVVPGRDQGNLRNVTIYIYIYIIGMVCRFKRWNLEHCKIVATQISGSKMKNVNFQTFFLKLGWLVCSEVSNLIFIVHLVQEISNRTH